MAGEVHPGDLRASLDENVREGLRLASIVLAGLLAFFAVADFFINPPRLTMQIAALDALASVAFLVVYIAVKQERVPPRRAHAVAAAVAGLVAATTLHDIYVLGDPEQTTYLMLVIVGCGSLFLHTRWMTGVVAGTFAGWLAVASTHPEVNWTTAGFSLFAASVLAILIHMVRLRTFERLNTLRLKEAGRKEQLQIREQALESAVEALQDSEERYRRLVESAPDAMLVIADGRILYANPTAVRLFGASSAQALEGVEAITLVGPEYRDLVSRRTAIVEAGRATEPAEIKCMRLDGTLIDVEVIGQPITFQGRPADQSVIRDIRDRKRAEAERVVAQSRLSEISRLKEMDRVKTQFVNTISHELRTPLTPIKVQLHILKSAKTQEQVDKASSVLDRNVTRLSQLVDELLEVARIQAGTLRLAKTYLDLSALVTQTLESFVEVGRQGGIELASKVEPGVQAVADPRRVSQVMYNLLGNAFKFTEPGGRITVEVRRDGANALVSVADSGMGMTQEDIARLFEPFSQVHDTMERTNAGTGLGLYICRGIVEGHGGRIWCESDGKGKGSRFAFVIPLAPPPDPPAGDGTPTRAEAA